MSLIDFIIRTNMPEETKNTKKQEEIQKIISLKEYYKQSSQKVRQKWTDFWKMYISWIDETQSPFLSNLFIPKTNAAIELLVAFLAGKNQTISASPEGKDDVNKALMVEKLLDFQWRKEINGRIKVSQWIKQAAIFGNGIIKCGWDADAKKPFLNVVNLPDVFMDYYTANIQETPVFHRIIKMKDDVVADERYDKAIAKRLIEAGAEKEEQEETKFSAYDNTSLSTGGNAKTEKVELWEYWPADNKRIITLGLTDKGWEKLRDEENEYKDDDGNYFKPFVKIHCKKNPLPNRAYDFGIVEAVEKIQKAFNDCVNEYFDNVTLINNATWIKRRGATITGDLNRRTGGIVEVDDINQDIRADRPPEITGSMINMIKLLDNEFQQGSMIVNLLKAVPNNTTATEAALGQQNVQTLLDHISDNIEDGMSELGNMLVWLNLKYQTKIKTILEKENEMVFLEIETDKIRGKYDIRVTADRQNAESRAVQQKQMLDLLALVGKSPMMAQKYPDLPEKIIKRWLEKTGMGDVDWFFEQSAPAPMMPGMPMAGGAPGMPTPSRAEGLTPPNINNQIKQF